MSLLDNRIYQYAEDSSSQQSDVLKELTRKTFIRSVQPRMLSGEYQGRLLAAISILKQPKRILEIGTFTGYSAICLSEGLQDDGELITIDKNEELEDLANEFFEKSGKKNKIKMLLGNALDIIPQLKGEFDMVFLDADKKNYIKYFELLADKISKNGVLLSDNVLWSGKVVEDLQEKDTDTQILIEFNKKLKQDKRFISVLLPIRDGITISVKI